MSGRNSSAGSALLVVLVVVVICAALGAAVIVSGVARHRESESAVARERAFQLAEAGIDWALATVRRANGALPDATTEQRAVGSVGTFVIRYSSGATNGADDDKDGVTDEADESDFVFLSSTGSSGGSRRTLEVVLRKSIQEPQISASVQFNVDTPILDLNGNAFLISGDDHDLNGDIEPHSVPKAGIASPAEADDLAAQIGAARQDQVQGAGGEPSIRQVDAIDLETLVAQATAAASVRLESGTHSHLSVGEATEAGVKIVYAAGDIHLSGDAEGAGVLVVDGDLFVSGSFTWRGLVIVRGRVTMTGGGHDKRIVGGLVIGEEITSTGGDSEVEVSGRVDLLYSSSAIRLASHTMVVMSVLVWSEAANP